jgi:type II secretory ATPase GspE/PulE/Tfp pilus assembly ATPase PilB-like protein
MQAKPQVTTDAPFLVDRMVEDALGRRASDIHVEPTAGGYEVRFRIDGLLETIAAHDAATGRSMVNRFMVLAKLLTYRLDIPQEGRLTMALASRREPLDLRVAVIPTTHGLRCAVRLPADLLCPRQLGELGLSDGVLAGLRRFARGDSGMLIVTGPAGSGKTTTIYALLEEIIAACPGQSVISLEDPVERHIRGVTQIEVSPFGELTYEKSLRSILRQDPQVIMLGEIRDAATATLAIQAALSGHRLICTLHAATPAGAISRLLEMGLEPYQISSAVAVIVAQRLLRRRKPDGGYEGRLPMGEFVVIDSSLRQAIIARSDADSLRKAYERQEQFKAFLSVAGEFVERGLTDKQEIVRIFGEQGV